MEIIKIIIEKVLNFIFTILGKNSAKNKDKYEFANDVLSLVYEIEDKVKDICYPSTMTSEEFMSIIESKKISEQEKNNAKVREFFKRYKENKNVFNRLYTLKNRFKVIFGKDKSKPFEDLKEIISEMDREELDALLFKLKNKEYYSISSRFSSKVNKILEEIENTCKPEPWVSKIFRKYKKTGNDKNKK